MLDSSVLQSFRPMVATPCYGGVLCLNYVLGIINLQRECANAAMALLQLAADESGDARRTLSAFAGSYPMFGTEAASYARAVKALGKSGTDPFE